MNKDFDLLKCTSDIVTAYLTKNSLKSSEIARLISDVHSRLQEVSVGAVCHTMDLIPAVPVAESVHPDYLVCLEDGKKLKMLKRHLRTIYDMSVEEYKRKWGLPPEYPTVAQSYAVRRSVLAKEIGLGKKREQTPKVTLRVIS